MLYAHDDARKNVDGLQKHEHFINAIKSAFPSDKHLVWHPWLHRAIDSFCYDSIASEWGASGMGKSSDYGLIAMMDVLADPANTLTVIVTNPLEMHWERLFKYANYYHSLLPKPLQVLALKKQNPLGLLYDYEKVAKLTNQPAEARRTGIICFSNKPGDSFEDLKRRIGAHERRMRLFVDEPQGCSTAVLKLKINMSAGSGVDYRERFLGNPSGRTDPLGKHSEPKDGDWKKTEYADDWETRRTHKGKNGKCFVRDGEKSPAIQDPKKYWFLFGADDLKDAKANYGEFSQEYWTYARGRLLGEGGSNVCITEPDLESLDAFRTVAWKDHWEDYAGLDAAAEASDSNQLYRVRCGVEANGVTVAAIIEKREIPVDITKPDKSGQIAKQVIQILNTWNISLDRLAGDTTGNQGPIFDRIESLSKSGKRVHRVNASGKCASPLPIFQGSHMKRADRYFNRSTELFFNVVIACQKKQLVLKHQANEEVDSKLVHQLTTRQKEGDTEKLRGKIKIEEKANWRKRNGGKSPDELDAVQQVLALLVEQGRMILNEGAKQTSRRNQRTNQQFQRPTYNERRGRRNRIIGRY
jgi:hypothetical protein